MVRAMLYNSIMVRMITVASLGSGGRGDREGDMERMIGSTELRRRLTDVLQRVREERDAYVIEIFDRPQAVLISLDEYRLFQRFKQERNAFFDWLDAASRRNAEQNLELSEGEVLAIVEEARDSVSGEAS